MRYLVDANVLSEPTKPSPNSSVLAWLREYEHELAISPVVLGELEYGILILPASRRRAHLEEWFRAGVSRIRILDFDASTAAAWARLLARLKTKGRVMSIKDSLIAATASAHRLIVATRDVQGFRGAGATVENPFDFK